MTHEPYFRIRVLFTLHQHNFICFHSAPQSRTVAYWPTKNTRHFLYYPYVCCYEGLGFFWVSTHSNEFCAFASAVNDNKHIPASIGYIFIEIFTQLCTVHCLNQHKMLAVIKRVSRVVFKSFLWHLDKKERISYNSISQPETCSPYCQARAEIYIQMSIN